MFPGPLRAFHEVVQAGSIRKASDRLGLAPSSVSRQIAVLEALMGTSLLSRAAGGVVLTHAGTLVAEYASSAVMNFDTLRQDLNDRRGTHGLIRVAMVESIASSGPAEAAARFRLAHPGVTFQLTLMPALAVIEAVAAQTTDIGIGFCAEANDDIIHEASIPEPLMLVLKSDHPMAGKSALTLSDLKPLSLALPDEKFAMRRLVDRAARRQNLSITPVMVSNSFDALRDFVRSGGGATILPMRAVRSDQSSALVATAIDDPELNNTTLDVIHLKAWRMPRIIRLYLEELQRTLAEHDLASPQSAVKG
jgi:DNA-binding transcriptional LysR family regulator